MVERSIPLTSSGAETGKLPFPTPFEKETELPTTSILLSLVIMLIVFILTKLIEPFGTTM
ncbi:hypothetical protein LINPERHAP2_LOCUS28634 [Linum perenne]